MRKHNRMHNGVSIMRNNIFFYLLVLGCTVSQHAFTQSESEDKDSLLTAFAPGQLIDVEKKNNTIAYSSVSGDELYRTTATNLSNTLYGKLPGLTVMQGSGQPGNDGAELYIRGAGTFNSSNIAVFVDGFQVPYSYFQYLLPAEIEEVSILKDAAALSTFGMKGANGVLWVTTKRGKIGKPNVRIQMRTGVQQPITINKPLQSYEYASLYNEAYNNDNRFATWQPYYSQQTIDGLKNGQGVNTDWYSQTLRNSTTLNTTDISLGGGSSAAKYYVVLGHARSNGLYNIQDDDTHSNISFRQFNLRANVDVDLFDIFEGRVGLSGRLEDRKAPNFVTNLLWSNLASYPNIIYDPINENGSYPGTTIHPDNPYASIRELGLVKNNDRSLTANIELKEKLDFITPGLYISQAASFNTWARGTYSLSKNYARILNGTQQTTHQNTNYVVSDDYGTNQWNWMQFMGGIGYDKHVGMHHFVGAANYLQYTYIVDANQNANAGVNTEYGFQNISARFHYDYNDRLSAEIGLAYSGSDNYRAGNRFGFYPSISVGYSIFNASNSTYAINLLKLRGSAGSAASDYFSGGRYLYQRYYGNTGTFATGNGSPTWFNGLGLSYIPNPDFFAERSTKYNIGLESRFFNSLNVQADAFIDKRTGIPIPNNSLGAVFGQNVPYVNGGIVTTTGFELSADFTKKIDKFSYSLGGNISYANPIITFMDEIVISPTNKRTGHTVGSNFGYIVDGFYDVTDFEADGTLKTGVPVSTLAIVGPGDVKYRDLNGDNHIDVRDISHIGGSFMPKINYAAFLNLGYSGFYFNVLMQGAAGRDINLLDARNQIIAFENNGNAYEIAQNRWAYFPDQNIDTRATATYPRLSLLGNNNNYASSSMWVKNGNFLRIRNVELGYEFAESIFRNTPVKGAKVFINAVNVLTVSQLLNEFKMDPETLSGYPATKSYSLGLSVNF